MESGDNMAITVGTDTYISLADADTYVAANYVSGDTKYTTWDDLSDGDKEIYLKNATKKLDRQILRGVKAVSTQTLEFPRALYTNYRREDYPNLNIRLDGDWVIETEVAQRVKDAQVEEALQILIDGSTANDRIKLQQQGVKSFKIGDLSESYGGGISSTYNTTRLLSIEAKELLRYYVAGAVGIC